MISVPSRAVTHIADPATGHPVAGDRHGGRSCQAYGSAGVPAGRFSEAFLSSCEIPLNAPLEKGETRSRTPSSVRGEIGSPTLSSPKEETGSPTPLVKEGRWGDFPGETELLQDQTPLELEFLHRGPGVWFGCIRLPYSNMTKRWRNWAKQAAVSALVTSVSEMGPELHGDVAARVSNMEIVSDSLGKPRLLIGGSEGPAVSFAYEGNTMWVAVGREGSSVGIDAAEAASFMGNYPFHRVFQEGELELEGDKEEVAALIWSAKEAVVKALGCGFHLVDPLQLRVEPYSADRSGFWLEARLTDRAGDKLGLKVEDPILVRMLRYRATWVSVASLV